MTQALLLNEWLDTDQDQQIANVDRTIRNELATHIDQALRGVLHSGDVDAQLAACTGIAEMGTSVRGVTTIDKSGFVDRTSLTRPLAPDLAGLVKGDPNQTVREAAALALSSINPDAKLATETLDGLLTSDQVGLRRAAAQGLLNLLQKAPSRGQVTPTGVPATPAEIVQTGTAVVPVAAKGLSDADVDVRRHCIEAIRAVAAAFGDLLPSSEGREAAGENAATRDRPPQAGEIQGVLPLIRALSTHTPALGQALNDADATVRVQAGHALEDVALARLRLLGRSTGGAPPILLPPPAEQRGDLRGSTHVRKVSLEEEAADTSARDPLLSGLRATLPQAAARLADPDVQVRLAVIDFLELLGPDASSIAGDLVKALCDPNLFVRWSSARVLGKMGPVDLDTTVPGLAKLLSDPDLDVRLAVATALARYGSDARAAVPALAEAINKGDAEFRIAAIHTAQAIGADAAPTVPAITAELTNPDARVRRAAAEGLGVFGPLAKSAASALRRILSDSDADVRRAAADALLSVLAPSLVEPKPERLGAPQKEPKREP
jgi:HEAT repeat protein